MKDSALINLTRLRFALPAFVLGFSQMSLAAGSASPSVEKKISENKIEGRSPASAAPPAAQNHQQAGAVDGTAQATQTAPRTTPLSEDLPFIKKIEELRKRVGYNKMGRSTTEGPRRLMPMPLHQDSNYFGMCGSRHYNPEPREGPIADAWTDPLTACAAGAFLQKWQTENCTDRRAGCVAAWGDISDRMRKFFSGHKTHTHGQCIDFRPLQKNEYLDQGLTYADDRYDREKTIEFIKLAKQLGAGPIFFNDPKVIKEIPGVKYAAGHANHIHLCFLSNDKVTEVCDNYKPDVVACPELLNPLHEGVVSDGKTKSKKKKGSS